MVGYFFNPGRRVGRQRITEPAGRPEIDVSRSGTKPPARRHRGGYAGLFPASYRAVRKVFVGCRSGGRNRHRDGPADPSSRGRKSLAARRRAGCSIHRSGLDPIIYQSGGDYHGNRRLPFSRFHRRPGVWRAGGRQRSRRNEGDLRGTNRLCRRQYGKDRIINRQAPKRRNRPC